MSHNYKQESLDCKGRRPLRLIEAQKRSIQCLRLDKYRKADYINNVKNYRARRQIHHEPK